jgi:peroxiredoxin
VVVFSRTVVWCPYCRNHIKEADFVASFLAQHGVNIVSITPDELDLHQKYAEMNALRHPLLSDPQRQAIKGFDVINGNIPKDVVGQRPDIPFPGYFVLDREGTIVDKSFLTDYQFRQSPSVAITRRFGWQGRPGGTAEADLFGAQMAISPITVLPAIKSVFIARCSQACPGASAMVRLLCG